MNILIYAICFGLCCGFSFALGIAYQKNRDGKIIAKLIHQRVSGLSDVANSVGIPASSLPTAAAMKRMTISGMENPLEMTDEEIRKWLKDKKRWPI